MAVATSTEVTEVQARQREIIGPDKEGLPRMSLDGGSEDEFERFWENSNPPQFPGGWIRYWSHPQVNVEPYWYNRSTRELVWRAPNLYCDGHGEKAYSDWKPLCGEGPEWTLSVPELKTILRDPRKVASAGLSYEELAKRACYEYEKFIPRVLSWHDYQYNTFWFFGGMKKEKEKENTGERSSAHFFGGAGESREMFAEDAFFDHLTDVVIDRMRFIHVINLTYMAWTFSRAGVIRPRFMKAVGDIFCDGRMPHCDRCSLGTIVWCFSKLNIRHDELFELASVETKRLVRLRSLAPRNYQNILIAYSRMQINDAEMVRAMSRQMPNLLDNHDPKFPKLKQNVLFSYTCRDGSEVPADCFRVSSLTVILSALNRLSASGPALEALLAAMADYTKRSLERSPPWMLEPCDPCQFLCAVGNAVFRGIVSAAKHMEALGPLIRGAPRLEMERLVQAYKRAGVSWPGSA